MEKKETKIIHLKDILRCPKCNSEIKKEVSFFGGIFNKKKKVIYYCPLCEFESEKIFKITNQQYIDESK